MSLGRLPTFVIIGAMKCGTTALHDLLDAHPDVVMSRPKELDFFVGPPQPAGHEGAAGNWWRGLAWYRDRFPAAGVAVGESSPGYTSPDHPEVAGRMIGLLPEARLVYLVRDPFERAVSQYLHHRRDGTEPRPLAEALLDPASHYLARSRFHERLLPFLETYGRDRILIVDQRDLAGRTAETLARIHGFIGVAPRAPEVIRPRGSSVAHDHPDVAPAVRDAFRRAVHDDQGRLGALLSLTPTAT